MTPAAWAAREYRFYTGLLRTLWRVRKVSPASSELVCDDFEAAVDKFADHTALAFEGARYTYRQLEDIANRIAAWTDEAGVKRGESVALFLPNRAEYVPIWMGLAKRGVAAALINTNLTGAALAHCISISNADHVICDASCLSAFDTIRVQLPRPLTLWTLEAPEYGLSPNHKLLDLKSPRIAPARPDRSVRAGLKAGDVALYIYTSGTTGMPKAAKITHARAQLYMRAFAGATGASAEDRIYCPLPLYHSTGGLCGVGAALLNGATLVLRRKFSASHFWSDVVENGVTMFVYIGELCRYLVNQPPGALERKHHLRLAFGNGLRPEVWDEMEARFGAFRVLEFYGSTEGNASLFNFDGQKGAIGRIPHALRNNFGVYLVAFDIESETLIRGPDGFCVECKPGEVGEAVGRIKDTGRHAYVGYADKAASDKKVARDVFEKGDMFFRTGDLLRQDKDGYFYFVDRIGDTFRWKGENVSTTEVAEAIARYPGVAEATVYGVRVAGQDGRAGMAAITPGAGASTQFDLDGLRAFLARELPSYARPLFIRIQPEIDATGTFKYRKMDLVSEGYDPAKTEHKLYFDEPGAGGYTLVTRELHGRIEAGAYKL